MLYAKGEINYTVDLGSYEAFETFEFNGIEVYVFCEDLITELSSLFSHFISFFGGLGIHG
jgi:hypothetical protein